MSGVLRPFRRHIGIRQLDEVQLPVANPQPGARIAEFGALGVLLQTQQVTVEFQRPPGVGHQQADMVNARDQGSPCGCVHVSSPEAGAAPARCASSLWAAKVSTVQIRTTTAMGSVVPSWNSPTR